MHLQCGTRIAAAFEPLGGADTLQCRGTGEIAVAPEKLRAIRGETVDVVDGGEKGHLIRPLDAVGVAGEQRPVLSVVGRNDERGGRLAPRSQDPFRVIGDG